MALRRISIRRAGSRPNLFMGGDRELVMFSGIIAATLAFVAQDLRVFCFAVVCWFALLHVFRQMAQTDPKMRAVYLRHRRYRIYYPPRSTPFRTKTGGAF